MSATYDGTAHIESLAWQTHTPANALADTILHVVLFVTVLSSFFVIIEPAPYEYLSAVLGLACVLARVRISRVVLPLIVLLLICDAGGAIGLLQILDFGWMRLAGEPVPLVEDFQYPDSIRFLGTSFYLGLSAMMIACICAQDTMRRTATLRSAYILAAVVASLLGTAGYFQLNPNLEIFTLYGRATGGFKGPNDMGAFLIPPLMWLIEGFIVDKIRLRNLVATVIIFIGMLLTFSRGALASSLVTAALLLYLLFVTQNDRGLRMRIVFFVAAGVVAAIAILLLLTSIPMVNEMFTQRAGLQDYDVGGDDRSRLFLQEDSLREIFNHPLGMGPWGFAHATDWVSHNTFLGTTLNFGWVGGAAYLTLIVLTLFVGFRALWMRTPWQTFLIATYPAFVAMVFEGFWGDTDHWRHFYILLGLVWGLAAATHKVALQKHAQAFLDRTGLPTPGMPTGLQTFRQSLGKPT